MITPRFTLLQDTSTLTILIRAPYCNLQELDISVDNNEFIFVCTPYYLRLNLPGNITEDSCKSSFDTNTTEFTLVYEKQNKGEEFANLDFITTFLQPKTINVHENGRKIEILTSEKDAADFVHDDVLTEYGFALRGSYKFQNLKCEFAEVFNIDPCIIKFDERKGIRVSSEKENFDPEHYIADIMDDAEIMEICRLECPWKTLNKDDIKFTEKELDILKDLPNINYSLTPQQINYCHTSLVEILFAYCYDRRTTYFEGTCESGWNISTISASLSWFDSFSNSNEAIICSYRRSLIYPLYRSFKLCTTVFEDLKSLLMLGSKYIIRCLIDLHYIFLHGNSGRYILNKLFIEDYIIYMMKCDSNFWESAAKMVCEMKINKSDLGLNLLEIEESIDNVELTAALGNLTVADATDSDDSCTSSDSESSSESDEETSSESEGENSDASNVPDLAISR